MISVYDNALSSPLTFEEAKKTTEFIAAASSVAMLMTNISIDAELEGAELEPIGKLLVALLSYPMEASGQIVSEKRNAAEADNKK